MKFLKEKIFKNRKLVINGVLALGILVLLIGSNFFVGGKSPRPPDTSALVPSTAKTDESYETRLERRLEEALSVVDGIGKVKVMLTISTGKELIVAEDITSDNSNTKELDSGGGNREINNTRNESKKLIINDRDGVSRPLVLKEVEPKIEGLIIVAEGGDNVAVKSELTKAAQAILGLEANRVQVLKMK